MVRPSKIQKRVESGVPKYRERKKHGSYAFWRHSRISLSSLALVLDRETGYPPRHRPRGSRWRRWLTDAQLPTVMVKHNPPWPPQLVGEVLGIGQLPDDLVEALLEWFRVTREDGGLLSTEKRSGCGVHSFLAYLASRVDPVPGFERVVML